MSEPELTPAQDAALRFAEYSATGDCHYCERNLDVRDTTLRALVRKGFLSDHAAPCRYWLTPLGEATRTRLLYETCCHCGAETHRLEAACVSCGVIKRQAEAREAT
jgi:hypothetical protein